jgi:uncharacterized protein YrrD
MRKGRELKNLPVIDVVSGQQLGYVVNFKIINHEILAGLYLVTFNNRVLYLARDCITQIGRDAVLVQAEAGQAIEGEPDWPDNAGLNSSAVMTTKGEVLGVLTDILLEDTAGNIMGYELSDGYFNDLLRGRKVIPTANIITWGKDTVIVDERV